MATELEKLRQVASRDPAALVKLADLLVAEGRAGEAVQSCRKGLSSRPDDVPLRLALGRALMANGDLEEAQAALADTAARQRKQAAAKLHRGEDSDGDDGGMVVEVDEPAKHDFSPTPLPPPRVMQPFSGELEPPPPPRRAQPAPVIEPLGPIDLAQVADALYLRPDAAEEELAAGALQKPPPDELEHGFQLKRARSFVWLWAGLAVATAGIIGGVVWRAQKRAALLAATVAKGDARLAEATYEGDLAARDAWAQAVRIEPKSRKYFAMVALGSARLAADHGEDTEAGAWAMLRRSEKEAARHRPEPDARTDRELRQARALMALHRGEACTDTQPEDGDIAARCAAQKGDVDGARKILAQTIASGGDAANLRALLALGSIELGAGDLDAADGAFRRVLQVSAQHPRALVGRALVQLERGEAPQLEPPPGRLGPTTEGWLHLAEAMKALGKGTADEDARAGRELDLARRAITHDGRLALLYGRVRLQEGKVSEAEQAMRIAERLDPNDGDVAVLDAEVALAKGFEEKVVTALAQGAATPRHLAVLGRAQALLGKYREAAATLDAALARRPGDATAVTYRAISRAHLGDQAGAMRELEKAAAQLRSTTPRYGLGLLAYERHDLLKAKSELSRALEHNSESFRARALLGRVLRDLGKPKEALVELERAARDAPALASVHQALGRLYLDLGRMREVRAELRPVIDAGKATSDDKLAYAEATLELGRKDEAEAALQAAADAGALAPRLARLRLVAQTLRSPKDAAAAAKLLEKERKGAAAHDARLALQAADAWRRAGDLKKAEDDYAAALYGDSLHANLGIGRLQLASADPSQAEASFRAALKAWELMPYGVDDHTEARVGLARALYAKRAYGEILETLKAAIAEDRQAPEPHYWTARALTDLGKASEARPHAEKAVELDDQYAEAWLLLGDLTRGDAKARDKARAAYKKYLELQPDGAAAKTAKKALASLR